MFIHRQKLQYHASPEAPDAVYARKLQEVIGGQYGEITVAMQYSFQAWNAHIPGKYRDLLFSTAAEEFGHVEMLATMVAQLLEKAPTCSRPSRPVRARVPSTAWGIHGARAM